MSSRDKKEVAELEKVQRKASKIIKCWNTFQYLGFLETLRKDVIEEYKKLYVMW